LRLIIKGSAEKWSIGKIEDLREMSASQWHEPIDLEEDWLAAIFGSDPEFAKTSSSSSSLVPVQPAKDDDETQDGELAQLPPDCDSEEPGQVACSTTWFTQTSV